MALEEVLGRAIVELRAPSDKLKKDLNAATGEVDRAVSGSMNAAGSSAGAVESKLSGATKMAGSLGATLLSAGIAVKLKGAADAAGNLAEAVNANQVVFKEGAKDFDKFAEGALKNLGLAEITIREMATGIGGMFSAVGLNGAESSKMTQDLITRARDVGSVFNESADIVAGAFGSALRGEAEPARRFGVFLTADAISAEALSSGLVKANVSLAAVKDAQNKAEDATKKHAEAVKQYGANSDQATAAALAMEKAQGAVTKAMEGSKVELTDAQKLQAAYQIVMRQTEQAAGDYKNTMNSKANSDQRAKEAAKEASASLGESLAPILGKVSQLAASAATAFTKLPGPLQTVVAGLLGLAVLAGPIGSVVTLLGALGIGGGAAAAGTTAAAGGTTALGAASTAATPGLMAMAAAMLPWILAAGLLVAAGYLIYRNWETIKDVGAAVWGWLGDNVPKVIGWIADKLPYLLGPLGILIKHHDDLKRAAGAVWDWLKDTVGGAADWIGDRISGLADTIGRLWAKIPGPLRGFIGGAGGAIGGLMGVIPGLASGGDVTRSGLVNVGEHGPEKLWLPRGASVEPLARGSASSSGGGSTVVIQGSVFGEREFIDKLRRADKGYGFRSAGG